MVSLSWSEFIGLGKAKFRAKRALQSNGHEAGDVQLVMTTDSRENLPSEYEQLNEAASGWNGRTPVKQREQTNSYVNRHR